MAKARETGEPYEPGRGLNPVRHALLDHENRYPLDRMREIEEAQRQAREQAAAAEESSGPAYFVQAGVYRDESRAVEVLTHLIDLGYDGTLISGERSGELLHEVRVGPFAELAEAQRTLVVLERSQELTPSILVEPGQP